MSSPWARHKMGDLVAEYGGVKDPWSVEQLQARLLDDGADGESLPGTVGKLWEIFFDRYVEPNLVNPTFVTDMPAEISPLARKSDVDSRVTDRFELFICGKEIANGFSELNDAEDQAERFRQQVAEKDAGDDEAMFYDEDYVTALEHGLPPTAGEGIGIDRLVMLFTDSPSIRDVILFPHMRPQGR